MEKIEFMEEPVFWKGSLEDLKKQKFNGKQRIIFICEKCGKEHNICFRRAKKIKTFICQSCQLKEYRERDPEYQKRINEKTKKTNLEKFGVENPMSLPEIKEKIRQTNLRKYGKATYTQTKEYKEKTLKTNRERYGTDWPMQNEEIKQRSSNTIYENYG